MKTSLGLWMALVLIGCRPSGPTDTIDSLVADPARLKEVQRQCRLDRAKVGDEICTAASEAFRRRFMDTEARERAP